MLTIRDSQMRALASAAQQDFENRLVDHLQTAFPLPPDQLRSTLSDAVRAAGQLGIERESDLALVLAIVHRLTGGFSVDHLPKDAQNILLAYRVDGAAKAAQLANWAAGHSESLPNTAAFPPGIPAEVVRPCKPPERATSVHWIEIELVGEDDQPIAGEEYRIHLPNGDVVRGYTNTQGQARVENIENPGACTITFPALDQDAWTPRN